MLTAEVSVLMSIYKREKVSYFIEAMESILKQTVQPKEIVLVKDGPLSDELDKQISLYKDQLGDKFVLVTLDTNVGLGKALAEGVKNCHFKLIARMDTDDIMLPERIEKQYMEYLNDPDLAIVGSDIVEFDENMKEILGYRIVPKTNKEIQEFSRKRNPFNHMTVMFKKDAILDVGNYQPLEGFEDYYLWVRLLVRKKQGKNLSEPLVYARTGRDMYARRGGITYLIPGLKARKIIYENGLGNRKDFLVVSLIHILICIVPNRIRGKIYKKMHKK